MSELKEHLFVPYSELQEGDELTDAITIAKSYYLKSEADKVIAEKDAEIVELKKACNDKDDWCFHTLKENRHHKYKRCLAMAKWSKAGMYLSYECDFKREWWNKWQKRWLELAKKFKPNSKE